MEKCICRKLSTVEKPGKKFHSMIVRNLKKEKQVSPQVEQQLEHYPTDKFLLQPEESFRVCGTRAITDITGKFLIRRSCKENHRKEFFQLRFTIRCME